MQSTGFRFIRPVKISIMKPIATTRRLLLREFTLDDAPFFLQLVNSPGWLEFIGDRQVRTVEDAENYLRDRNIKSYAENGFGFWPVILKETGQPIGTCGLIQRDFLDHVDIGFAFLPEFFGKGYALESARAVMRFAKKTLRKSPVLAFCDPDNVASISLLRKIGLRPSHFFDFPETREELLLLTDGKTAADPDRLEVELLTRQFFGVFTKKGLKRPRLRWLEKLCLPKALFIKCTGYKPEIFNLRTFAATRRAILEGGELAEFAEFETSGETKIAGGIAQRFSFYEKSGIRDGAAFEEKGAKTFQFVKTAAGWRISAVAWT